MSVNNTHRKSIAIWLLICCVSVFAMTILGGVTRLTGSGLSMVEWEPIMGILPPFTQGEWENTFSLYQQFPEYKLKNQTMSLGEFKSIFWFEYAHRLLGRSIGLIFFFPFVFFLVRGKVDRALAPKLVSMLILGGLQGLMGWYMVKSGLVNDPHVSQYRLTAHLALAIIIFSYMFWVALDLLYPTIDETTKHRNSGFARLSIVVTSIIFITAMSGGFVAGTHAGRAFNTFPLMDGKWIPDGLLLLSPTWLNFFENIITIQFDHRVLATLLFLLIPFLWWITRKSPQEPRLHTALHLLLAALVLQISLGISTLLLVVPIALAAAHQAGAIVLLTVSLFVSHQLRGRITK